MVRKSVRWSDGTYYIGNPPWCDLLDIPRHIQAIELYVHAALKRDAEFMLEDRGMRYSMEGSRRDHSTQGTALEEAGLFVPGTVLVQHHGVKDSRVLRINPDGEAVHVATWQYETDRRKKPSGLFLLVHE